MILEYVSTTPVFNSIQLSTVLIGSVLLCTLAFACMRVLRRHAPTTRHFVIAASMMAHLILLTGFLLLPKIQFEVIPQNWTATETLPNETGDLLDSMDAVSIAENEIDNADFCRSIATAQAMRDNVARNDSDAHSPSELPIDSEFKSDSQLEHVTPAHAPSLFDRASHFVGNNVLFSIWAFGFLACITWLGFAHWLTRRMVTILDQVDLESLNSVLDLLGIKRKPTIRMWNDNRIPMQIGLLRPTVVLPKSFDDWSDSRQRHVLMHELTHVSRRDGLHDLTSWIAASIFWFNPLIWLLKRRQEQERELACDQSVVALSDLPADYAADLVSVVREASSFGPPTAIAMARTSELKRRIENIIGFDPKILKRRKTLAWILCGFLMISAGLGSSIAFSQVNLQDENEEPEVELFSPYDFEATLSPNLRKSYNRTLKGLIAKNGQRIVAKISASGTVVDSDGNPVSGANVYLRESWHHRMIEETGFNQGLRAAFEENVTSTCLAKMKTKSDGSFAFSEIDTPEFFEEAVHMRDGSLRWSIYVVGSEEGKRSVAWHKFSDFEPEPFSIALPRSGRVKSQVLAPNGKPVSNAKVTLIRLLKQDGGKTEKDYGAMNAKERRLSRLKFYSLGNSKLSHRTTTDADGMFEIGRLPIDHTVFARIDHPEFIVHDPKPIPVFDRDSEPTKIELDPGWQVSVTAVTPKGDPIPNLKFNLSGNFTQDIPFWSIPLINFELDKNGKYTSPALPKCDVSINLVRLKDESSATPLEWTMRPQKVERVGSGETKEVKLQLSPGRMIHGKVVEFENEDPIDANDFKDLSAMFFVVDPAKSYNWEQHTANVDSSGKFALRVPDGVAGQVAIARRDGTFVFDLPTPTENGSYSARISQRNEEAKRLKRLGAYKTQWETVPLEKMPSRKDIASGEIYSIESPLVLPIQRSLSIDGTLFGEDSLPVAFAKFETVEQGIPHDSNGLSIEFPPLPTTDKDGRFVLTGLQRRYRPIYRIKHPTKDISTDFGWEDFVGSERQGATLKFQRGVDVRAIVTIDGNPLADQDIYLRVNVSGSSMNRKATTNVSGVCLFEDVPRTPRASLYIPRSDQDNIDRSFSTLGDQSEIIVDKLNFISEGNGLVEGTIVDPQGNPVANASVSVIQFKKDLYDYGTTYESVKSNDQGRFKATKLPLETKLIIRVDPEQSKEARFPRDSTPTSIIAMSGQTNIRIILDPRLSQELPWRTKR